MSSRTLLAAAMASCLLASAVGAAESRAEVVVGDASGSNPMPRLIGFEKSFDPEASEANGKPTWSGTTSRGGSVELRLLRAEETEDGQRLVVKFFVEVGKRTLVARLSGTFDEQSQWTHLRGRVTGRWLQGARAREQGLRVDEATSHFVGALMILPRRS